MKAPARPTSKDQRAKLLELARAPLAARCAFCHPEIKGEVRFLLEQVRDRVVANLACVHRALLQVYGASRVPSARRLRQHVDEHEPELCRDIREAR